MDDLKDKCAIISNSKEIDVYLDSFTSLNRLINPYKEWVKAKYGQIEGNEYLLIHKFSGLAKFLEFFCNNHPGLCIEFSGIIKGNL